jgi:hypothetical protein
MKLKYSLAILGIILLGAGAITGFHPLLLIGAGLFLLITSLLQEYWSSRATKTRAGRSEYWLAFGVFSVPSGKLMVTDGGESMFRLELQYSCDFEVHFQVLKNEHGTIIKAIRMASTAPFDGRMLGKYELVVDTCLLAVLDEALAEIPFDKSFKQAGIYPLFNKSSSLPAAHLRDDKGTILGVVAQTGLGDGKYTVLVGQTGKGALEISCDFLESDDAD